MAASQEITRPPTPISQCPLTRNNAGSDPATNSAKSSPPTSDSGTAAPLSYVP